MNKKRFKGYAEKTGQHYMLIINDELGEEYCLTDDFFKSKDIIFEIVDLLNVMNDTLLKQAKENHKLSNKNIEQQTTINKLNGELELTANTKLYSRRELERKVDEQQATIRKLQDLCGESDSENAKLRIENKKLKAKLKGKEEDEQLYANEILELREANKEFIQFKELGGDY